MGLVIENNVQKFLEKNEEVLDSALDRMSEDFVTNVKIKMPRDSQEMEQSTKHIKGEPLKHAVIIDVPYAWYQEKGRRKDGSRVVKNYTTPGTNKDFVANTDRVIKGNALNYIKQAVSIFKGGKI